MFMKKTVCVCRYAQYYTTLKNTHEFTYFRPRGSYVAVFKEGDNDRIALAKKLLLNWWKKCWESPGFPSKYSCLISSISESNV